MFDMEGAELLLQKTLFFVLTVSGDNILFPFFFFSSSVLSSVFHVNPKEYAR